MRLVILFSLLVVTAACAPSSDPMPIRLVDAFAGEMVQGGPSNPAPPPPRTQWTFADPTTGTNGFSAFANVSGLAVRDGLLVGRSTSDTPLIHIERTTGLENQDQLHSIEVKIRVSPGANFSIVPGGSTIPIPPPQALPGPGPVVFLMTTFGISTPLVAGDEVRTYTLRSPLPITASRVRHMYIRPTDVAGADFAIESIRFIFREEYLAGIESGIGFQGMSDIYRGSIVSRAPETIRIPLELPSRPSLDLAVGTVDDVPVTFRVSLDDDVVFEQTVTTPYRWEHRVIDLAPHAGRSANLSLSLDSDQEGAIGIWGTPVVRQTAGADSRRPRGVIVLWTDTLRIDHLSVYGYERETAPNLKRMASQGVLFLNTVSQATWTKVSTPSLATSLYPSTHGVKEFSDFLPASAVTLAELYREAGYATVSFETFRRRPKRERDGVTVRRPRRVRNRHTFLDERTDASHDVVDPKTGTFSPNRIGEQGSIGRQARVAIGSWSVEQRRRETFAADPNEPSVRVVRLPTSVDQGAVLCDSKLGHPT